MNELTWTAFSTFRPFGSVVPKPYSGHGALRLLIRDASLRRNFLKKTGRPVDTIVRSERVEFDVFGSVEIDVNEPLRSCFYLRIISCVLHKLLHRKSDL